MACLYDSLSHLLICKLYINSSNACTVLCRTLLTRDTYSSDNGMKSEWSTLLFVTHLFWRCCCRFSYTTRCAWSTTSRYTCKVCMLQVIIQILIFLVRKSEVFGILVMLLKDFVFTLRIHISILTDITTWQTTLYTGMYSLPGSWLVIR